MKAIGIDRLSIDISIATIRNYCSTENLSLTNELTEFSINNDPTNS